MSSRARSSSPDAVRLRLPVPFPIGHVNAYVLPGEPFTLVDPGPRWDTTRAHLEAALRALGRRVEDVELVLLTHHHDDHAGLAAEVRERAGCEVAAHARTADALRDHRRTRAAEDRIAASLLRCHGAPAGIVATVAEATQRALRYATSVVVDRPLEDGDRLTAGGREHAVQLVPGHSCTDTLYVDDRQAAIAGDLLFATGLPVLLAHDGPRARAPLARHRDALRRAQALHLSVAYVGHGDVIHGPDLRIRHALRAQDERARDVFAAIPGGSHTAWELVRRVWPARRLSGAEHPISWPFVVLCDMLACLERLREQRLVVADVEDVVRFRRSRQARHQTSGW